MNQSPSAGEEPVQRATSGAEPPAPAGEAPRPRLPTPSAKTLAALSTSGVHSPAPHEAAEHATHHRSFWLWVMCLTGVDYFSTLGYQPSIAFASAGVLAPLATVVLVLVTLLGALPVYAHVASASPNGQGSIAMLERLMRGWTGKTVVLALLGFAATDFVITMTLSSADAAVHLIENPLWKLTPDWIHGSPSDAQQRIGVTVCMLVLLGACFMRGFKEVIGLAVGIVAVYLALNLLVIGSGLVYLVAHPERFYDWQHNLTSGNWHIDDPPLAGHGWGVIVALSMLYFPKLALGLSGFETGVAVMPLIQGDPGDDPHHPRGRIRNTRRLLVTAALVMSAYLLGSAFVVATLIPPDALKEPGPAADRALAYLAHGQSPHDVNPMFGEVFGTIYDISTIVILGFAGAARWPAC